MVLDMQQQSEADVRRPTSDVAGRQPETLGVVILAAGRGSRLGCTNMPKVMMEIGGRPILEYAVSTLEDVGFSPKQIVLVVGFQKEKVQTYFGRRVSYVSQEKQVGTAHAAFVGMDALSDSVEKVVVMGGDDGAFYTANTLQSFVNYCGQVEPDICVMTSQSTNPQFGRVLRDEKSGHVIAIKEKEELSQDEIVAHTEVNTGTYVINKKWFEHMFPHMPITPGLGEYGLPKAIEVAIQERKQIRAFALPNVEEWFSINTTEQLREADNRKQL